MQSDNTDLGTVKIDIISGFLGAGKTTFINKLLAEGLAGEKVALVENEFGDVSIDDALLEADGFEVETLASGCICCSLHGDFVAALDKIVRTYHPERIIIEPTGLATPTSLVRMCTSELWQLPLQVDALVTVVDARELEELLDLEIPIFEDQLSTARLVALSHTQELAEDELALVEEEFRAHLAGPEVAIIDTAWDEIDALEILGLAEVAMQQHPIADTSRSTPEEHESDHQREHEHEDHEHAGHEHAARHHESHEHHHHEVGGCVSFSYAPALIADDATAAELTASFDAAPHGTVLRAKGFLMAADGSMLLYQYVPGSGTLVPSSYAGDPKFAVIGRGIKRADFEALLG